MSAAAVLARASRGGCGRGVLSAYRLPNASARRIPALAAIGRYYASKSFPSHTIISMPALSPTMTSGNIGTWQKSPGDSLAPGEVLVEIETDKAQMDFEFQEEGILAKILKESGEKDVAVGNPIAVMVEDAGDVEAFKEFTVEDAGGDKAAAAPKEGKSEGEDEGGKEEAPAKEEKKEAAPAAQESESSGEQLQPAIDREGTVSPAAKRLALEKGVAISQVKGTGPGGRVTKSDVEKFKPASGGAPAAGPTAAPAAASEDLPASSMRKTIASRLSQSWTQNPHFFVSSTVSVSKLLKLRAALNAASEGKYKLSVNDFLIKAVAAAAKKVPAANSSWQDQGSGNVVIRQNNVVDVSVAVATPVGLITPVVKNVTGSGLETISASIKDLGKRARDGKLKPDEYQGGTITISNMGMNDAVERFTAVINPPQSTIVAVGAVKKVAVPREVEGVEEAGVEWDEQIVLTGSFDHKVVDGSVGGEYMRELKRVVENPLEMML